MTGGMWISLLACAGQLALAGLALVRVGKSPLALPLSLLSITLSTWNFSGFALVRADEDGWRLVGFTAGLMTVPCALHFILSFVGRRRSLAWAMYGAYALFGVLALAMLVALGAPTLEAHLLTLRFGLLVSALAIPILGGGFALLGLHVLRSRHPDERARAGLVLLGLTLVVALLMTELAAELGLEVVRLGHVGTLLGLPVMATAALRFGLFGDDPGAPRLALHAAGIAGLGVLAYLAVVRLFVAQAGTLIICTTAVTFGLVAATRRGVTAYVSRSERLERLATLGRFSAQMAHDLKNPIAAMKGAAQYLKEEHARGRPWDGHGEFLDLLLEQVERLDRVVDTYQRLARVEPLPKPVDLRRLVEGVLSLQAFASPGKVVIVRELAAGLPPCAGDQDLLANALENLVRNACEAMPQGGTLTVRALRDGADVALEVEDTGEGMDARTRERAFDDFFTTKATGSGLGLAFVRRVVEAHGGEVLLTSREGRGTVVRMRLPVTDASLGGTGVGEAA
ncbi:MULTISPECIES: ATP-binding protein [Myxococcus]|uniref:histidine kinase n=1 Tax=Myxococcus xanthus TaxID=34 RepID=A0AAE6FWS9_MYXXA|nr:MULTISPECIES: ATP-binding protein [Myxococcus]QDE66559.1 two-component sensor histidine kinase [Myxococcus xanthus]QDE73832.1 two-component sensor histidine kinase [Myxococcus xanthus]QDE81094.1 two-component sensor histidine kinase [Myxococcus xanthus]QDE95425.1 two-component sensor histidine kinase [Myxococcus xanthus]WAM27636.1 ATP-binding protein [Myxococcus sp. NMCA1]